MEEQGKQEEHGFEFGGSGMEYFKIWIVNLLLTILTLGIYSAWAKVRRMQYFYRNTKLAGASFDYHGQPKAILKGRLIALGLFTAYNLAFKFNPILGAIIGLVLAVAMPWLLVRSLRFKLYNSSYRGLRFNFNGSTRGAYRAFIRYPAIAGLTLYLLAPLAHQRIKQYQFNGSQFGRTAFNFGASVKSFYIIYFSPLVMMAGAAVLAFAAFQMLKPVDPKIGMFVAFMIPLLFLVMVSALFVAYMQNLIWNNTTVGEHTFYSEISARRMLWIGFTNFLGVLLTLGLYKPFATIRMLRYKLESMGLMVKGELSDFVAGQQQLVSAAGEETAEMFDVDISF